MKKWLMPTLTLAAVGFILSFNLFYERDVAADTVQLPAVEHCAVNKQVCQVDYDGHSFSFSITPYNAKPMTPLTLTVKLLDNNAEQKNDNPIEAITVTIDGVNMAMNGFPIKLTPNGENEFQGTTSLALCTLSRMEWKALVAIKSHNTNVETPFLFSTDSHTQ